MSARFCYSFDHRIKQAEISWLYIIRVYSIKINLRQLGYWKLPNFGLLRLTPGKGQEPTSLLLQELDCRIAIPSSTQIESALIDR